MEQGQSFSEPDCTEHMPFAERELSAFIAAVAELFGPEQATLSAQDWLDESELVDSRLGSTNQDWRTVTISSSVRLARRLNAPGNHQTFSLHAEN